MNKKCQDFEKFLLKSDKQIISKDLPAVWKNHLADCKECQTQWEAHRNLRGSVSSISVPHLSEGFTNKIRIAANQQYSFKAPRGWTLFLFRLYWIVTTFATLYIISKANVSLPNINSTWLILFFLIICFASPLFILRRSRITLFDFVLKLLG